MQAAYQQEILTKEDTAEVTVADKPRGNTGIHGNVVDIIEQKVGAVKLNYHVRGYVSSFDHRTDTHTVRTCVLTTRVLTMSVVRVLLVVSTTIQPNVCESTTSYEVKNH